MVWNKGKKLPKEYGKKISETMKKKGIKPKNPFRWTGKKRPPYSKEWLKKMSDSHKGNKHSESTRKKMSITKKGDKSHLWKGGITPLTKKIRSSFEYRQWRSDIFTRDNFICQECGNKGGNLNAHHIYSFSNIIKENKIKTLEQALECEELWNINNGLTLCQNCHELTNNYKKR